MDLQSGPSGERVTCEIGNARRINVPSEQLEQPVDTSVKGREVNIIPLNRGYIVKVGCQNFAFEDRTKMLKLLTEYLEDPGLVEKKYFSGNLF